MKKHYFSPSKNGFYIDTGNRKLPDDKIEITDSYKTELFQGQSEGKTIQPDETGYPILIDRPAPTTPQLIEQIAYQIQKRLDDFAKTKGYDSLLSACSYATSSVSSFSAEGQYCVNIRDSTWNKYYEILSNVNAKIIPLPSYEEVAAQLPELIWPT
jgi:hypothetical protein